MKGRLLLTLLVVGSMLLVFLIAALRFRHQPAPTQALLALLPAIPDLRRWPQAMQDRVTAVTKAATDSSEPIKAWVELAQIYFSNGFTTEATQTLQALIKRDASNGRWPYLLGYLEERAEHREAALGLFAKAALLEPHYAPALIHRANLLAISGQSDLARQLFNQCLILSPKDPRAPYGLAKLDFARGDEPAAIQRLRQIVQQYPKFQEAHFMLADLLTKTGDAPQAAEQRAFLSNGQGSPPDLDPYVDETYQFCFNTHRLQALGELRNQAQDYESALPYLQRAVQVDPKDPELHEALARTYMGLNRREEAQHKLQLALQSVGPNDQLYSRLAEVLLAQNKGNEAVALLLNAPGNPPAATIKNALGLAYMALERTPEAIEAFTSAHQLDPLFPDAQINLARCYLKSGDPRLARSWAEQALKLRPEALDGLTLLTVAALQMNDIDAATTTAQELSRRSGNAAEYRPLYTSTMLRAGNLAAERGEHTKAEQFYRAGLTANDSDGQLHGALGMLHGKLHHYAEAKAEFETFLRLEPRNPLGYLLLGAALNAESNPVEARTIWKAGLAVAVETQDNARAGQLRKLLGE